MELVTGTYPEVNGAAVGALNEKEHSVSTYVIALLVEPSEIAELSRDGEMAVFGGMPVRIAEVKKGYA